MSALSARSHSAAPSASCLSVLVVGIEDAAGVSALRLMESAGHHVSAALPGRRGNVDGAGPGTRVITDRGWRWLRQEVRSHDVVAVLAPLVTDPCSAVAHCLAAPVRARRAKFLTMLADALAQAPPRRLIVRSSAALYADHGTGWIHEHSSIEPCQGTLLAASAEGIAQDHARRGGLSVILRMARIYGPGDAWTASTLRLAARGWQVFDGPGDAYVPLVHVEAAARAIACALTAPGGVYNVADRYPATNGELNLILAEAVGRAELHPLWPSIRRADRDRLTRSLRVGAHRLGSATGWQAALAPEVGFQPAASPSPSCMHGSAGPVRGGRAREDHWLQLPPPATVDDQITQQAQFDLSAIEPLTGPTGRAFLEAEAGGNPSTNIGVNYRQELAHSDQLHLVQQAYRKGGLSLNTDLQRLNAAPRVRADATAASWLARYGVPAGTTSVPVLTIHGTSDGAVPAESEHWYAAQVRLEGDPGNLRQLFVRRGGHCSFTASEEIIALSGLQARLDTGRWPALGPTGLNADALSLGPAYQQVNDWVSGPATVRPAFVTARPRQVLRPSPYTRP